MSSRCAYARITPADIRMMLMALRPIAFLTAAALLAACGPANDSTTKAATAAAPAILATPQGKDVNSYANPLEARVTQVALDLAADFDAHVLAGTATLDIAAEIGRAPD